jgi:Polyketide cyclase / dehydrase and lipid transport
MARYVTTIESTLSPPEAFAYLADFSNASRWDPSVVESSRSADGAVGPGSTFDLIVIFGGRKIPMRYELVSCDEPRLFVIESRNRSFTSRDTITVTSLAEGSSVKYNALLEFKGAGRVLDPIMQLLFKRTGDKAAAGLRAALNP